LKGSQPAPATAAAKKRRRFNLQTFLSTVDGGRTIAVFPKRQPIFAQGDPAEAVFYIQSGNVKLTVLSKIGKEATIGILNGGDFFGKVASQDSPSGCALLPQ